MTFRTFGIISPEYRFIMARNESRDGRYFYPNLHARLSRTAKVHAEL